MKKLIIILLFLSVIIGGFFIAEKAVDMQEKIIISRKNVLAEIN